MRLPAIDWSWKRLSVKIILLIIMFNCNYDNNQDNNKLIFVEWKLTKIIVSYSYSFFLKCYPQFTENIYRQLDTFFIALHIFLLNFKLYSHICPPHESGKSWCRLYTQTRFFLLRFLEPKGVQNNAQIRVILGTLGHLW